MCFFSMLFYLTKPSFQLHYTQRDTHTERHTERSDSLMRFGQLKLLNESFHCIESTLELLCRLISLGFLLFKKDFQLFLFSKPHSVVLFDKGV